MFKSTKMAAPPPRVKVKNAIVSLLLVAALVITGALAFLTAKDSAENKFTVGNVNISLTEPKWDEANPDGTLENIVAGQVITKDPTITNTGVNNAYVYFQVEIPKVYKTDIIGADDTVTEMTDYPLFTMQTKNGDTATDLVAFDAEGKPYSTNEDFVIVDSFIDDTQKFAYDYYLFAYVGETEPKDTVKLFDQIQFANITDKFENLANGTTDDKGNTTFPAITNLQVNVKAYAIQSDFYNNEAGEEKSAANAWSLYVKQNDWKWEPVNYEGISTMSFVNEDNQVVYTESGYAGTPVTMYFEPSLAKTGYTFDWVNEDTGDVAYSGMPMPETDTTLKATYTNTGYEATTGLVYRVDYSEQHGWYAALIAGTEYDDLEYFGTLMDTTVVVPATINVKLKARPQYDDIYVSSSDASVAITNSHEYIDLLEANVMTELEIPVLEISSESYYEYNGADYGWGGIPAKNLILPDSVIVIDAGGVTNSSSRLESINIPYGMSTVQAYAFQSADALKEITLPNSIKKIEDHAFYECSSLETVNFPSGLVSIDNYAFAKCPNLNIVLPDSIINIGAFAFQESGVGSLIIPKNATNVKNGVFHKSLLTDVSIYADTANWDNNAFSYSTALTTVKLYDGVTTISSYMFRGSSVTDIYISSSVTSIQDAALHDCPLANIYYEGTEAEWQQIEIAANNDSINGATIHYNYTY